MPIATSTVCPFGGKPASCAHRSSDYYRIASCTLLSSCKTAATDAACRRLLGRAWNIEQWHDKLQDMSSTCSTSKARRGHPACCRAIAEPSAMVCTWDVGSWSSQPSSQQCLSSSSRAGSMLLRSSRAGLGLLKAEGADCSLACLLFCGMRADKAGPTEPSSQWRMQMDHASPTSSASAGTFTRDIKPAMAHWHQALRMCNSSDLLIWGIASLSILLQANHCPLMGQACLFGTVVSRKPQWHRTDVPTITAAAGFTWYALQRSVVGARDARGSRWVVMR